MSNSSTARRLRIVFDTNIYLAAYHRPGMSEELLQRAGSGSFELITSQHILEELMRKLKEKNGYISANTPGDILQNIREIAHIVTPTKISPVVLRDPDDDHILACAKGGKADCIVTLDKDLLDLKEWEGIAIIHPKTFSFIV